MKGRRYLSTLCLLVSAMALAVATAALLRLAARPTPVPEPVDLSVLDSLDSRTNRALLTLGEVEEVIARRQEVSLQLLDAVDRLKEQVDGTTVTMAQVQAVAAPVADEGWKDYGANPVFTRDGPVAWPCVVYDRDAFGLPGGVCYKMWYDMADDGVTRWDVCRIGLAVSRDGIRWEDKGEIERAGRGEQVFAGHPSVLYSAFGFGQRAPPYRLYLWDPTVEGIRSEESLDGYTWDAKNSRIVITEAMFLVPGVVGRTVFGAQVVCDDPGTPTDARDDRFKCWVDLGGSPCFLSSLDGVKWTVEGFSLAGTRRATLFTSMWGIRETGGRYRLFASYAREEAGRAPGGAEIGTFLAQSLVDEDQEPPAGFFRVGDGAAWRSQTTMCPSVVYDPDGFSGHGERVKWKMWYAGSGADQRSGIGYATWIGE